MRWKERLFFPAFLLWGAFVVTSLIVRYAPSIPRDNFVFDDIAFDLLLFLVAAMLGWKLLATLKIAGEGGEERLFFALLLGLGTLSLLTFLVGLAGGYRLSGFLLLLGGCVLWSGGAFFPLFREAGRALRRRRRGDDLPRLGILLAALLTIFHSLAPPTMRDELIAHLAFPKRFLEAGRIVELPFTSFSYYPLGLDLLFGMAMAFTSDIAARLLHVGVALLALWGIYLVARRIMPRKGALWATFFLAHLPLVIYTAGKAYVDMGVLLYLAGALLALDGHFEGKGGKGRMLALCGLFLGFGFGVKYNAMLFFPTFLFGLLWLEAKRRSPRAVLAEGGALLLPLLLACAPWMIRNLWLTGNPIFPFFNGLFHGRELMPGLVTVPELQFRVYTMGWPAQFLIPWLVSVEMTGREVYAADGIIGPLFLILAPFGWLAWRRKPLLLKFLGFVTLGYFVVAWFIGGVRLRYYLPMLPFCAILSAKGWTHLLRARGWRWAAVGIGGLLIAYNFVVSTTYLRQADPWPFLLGVTGRETYLLEHLSDYRYMKFMNETLPPDASVMLIYSNRGYYLERDYRYDAKFSGYTLKRFLREAQSARDLAERFRALGITHLYIELRGLSTDMANDPLGKSHEKIEILRRFLFQEATTLLRDERALVVALPPPGGGAGARHAAPPRVP